MKSFLRDYMLASSGTECPDIYLKWSAIGALSSIVSRRVWLDRQIYKCRCNMYIFLVGNAGSRKSTAMDMAQHLVYSLKTTPIAPTSITKEALTKHICEQDSPHRKSYKILGPDGKPYIQECVHASIFADELVSLLGMSPNPMSMIDFLTAVYQTDHLPLVTKNAGSDSLDFPYINILGCVTTDTISSLLKTKIISGGFHRRCVFVCSNEYGSPVAHPNVTGEQNAAWERCSDRAKEIQKLSGEFTWTNEAYNFYRDWYETYLYRQKVQEESQIREGFLNSKGDIVLKVAMLVAISDSDNLKITKEALEVAIALLDEIEPAMHIVFDGVGRNELSPIASAIKQMVLTSDKPTPVKTIYRIFYDKADTEEIDKMLSHLCSTGQIEIEAVTLEGHPIKLAGAPGFLKDISAQVRQPEV